MWANSAYLGALTLYLAFMLRKVTREYFSIITEVDYIAIL